MVPPFTPLPPLSEMVMPQVTMVSWYISSGSGSGELKETGVKSAFIVVPGYLDTVLPARSEHLHLTTTSPSVSSNSTSARTFSAFPDSYSSRISTSRSASFQAPKAPPFMDTEYCTVSTSRPLPSGSPNTAPAVTVDVLNHRSSSGNVSITTGPVVSMLKRK